MTLGKFNVIIVVTVINTSLVTTIWVDTYTHAAVFAFSVVYGIMLSAFIPMVAPLIAQISKI